MFDELRKGVLDGCEMCWMGRQGVLTGSVAPDWRRE